MPQIQDFNRNHQKNAHHEIQVDHPTSMYYICTIHYECVYSGFIFRTTDGQMEESANGFRIIKPDASKHAKLHEIAKREEELWTQFKERNRITSVHEVHTLGGAEAQDDVNKARTQYFNQLLPTKYERLVNIFAICTDRSFFIN